MKTVYFVRHGESVNNATHKYNDIDTPLSKAGEAQALEIAKRCQQLPIDVVVASDMERARQTAGHIVAGTNLKTEFSALFRERITATVILGRDHDDPEVRKIVMESWDRFDEPGWRFPGGENFEDLKMRALAALDFLAERTESNILVVSHGFFMYVVAAAILFGKEMTSHECRHVINGFGQLENTALSVATRGGEVNKTARSEWVLEVWNDHAHLG
ncbi:MAG: histidine phosphatase family protein [Candidatus Kaiserbacteria bacterium]|nr:MAG: histidine phosphatase family protein [Candidatus Kaiserbacteria bacterium]